MDRRKTAIIAIAATGVVAATAAVALSVPTAGTMAATDEAAIEAQVVEPTSLHATSYLLGEQYLAFTLDEAGALTATGSTEDIDAAILEGITAQLQAAPAYSAVIVDTETLDDKGLTTVLTTVTPTNGMTIATTNEEMQAWLAGVFPGAEGTMSSLDVANIPNAAFTYTQTTADEITWTVTEYVFQYGDATVSARLSTSDETGEVRAAMDQVLAGATRG